MAHLDKWGGAGRSIGDQNLLLQPGGNRMGEHHATVGSMPPNQSMDDAKMAKYMKDDRFFPYFGFANKMVCCLHTNAFDTDALTPMLTQCVFDLTGTTSKHLRPAG